MSSATTEPLLYPFVVEDSQGDGSLPDPACTNEGNWYKLLSEVDDLLDQLVASKASSRWWRWYFS